MEPIETENTEFETFFETPVDFFAKSIDDGQPPERWVKGIMSTEDEDADGEVILQKGLDCSYLMDKGYINYDHQRKVINGARVPIIIGVPKTLEKSGHKTILSGVLLNGDPMASETNRLANEMWELGMSLQKAGSDRRLAFSVEGPPPERRGKKIVKAQVHHVALTHKPVNAACSVELFMKSLCCGRCSPDHPQYNPAHSCGNKQMELPLDGMPHLIAALEKALEATNSGPISSQRPSPLMVEGLDRAITTVLYGDEICPNCYIPETGRFHKGIQGAFNHMTKCVGHGVYETNTFLKGIVYGARKSQELTTLIKTAGFIRQ
jgi:hypothetical protein